MTIKAKLKAALLILLALATLFFIAAFAFGAAMKIIYPLKYSEYVEKYSQQFEVEENLIYAVIKTESSFNPDAVSSADAEGLTQITPETFEWLCSKLGENPDNLSLFDPETSIKYGTFFLSYLLQEFGDKDVALAAYHAGRGRVNAWLEDKKISPDGKTLVNIPIDDTAHYIKKVNKAYNAYNKLYS